MMTSHSAGHQKAMTTKPINISSAQSDPNNNAKCLGDNLGGTGSALFRNLLYLTGVMVGVPTTMLPAATYYASLPPTTPGTPSSPVANNSTYEVIPHRIFVGGFAATTTEQELRSFFEAYGSVREVKVIRNPEGSSKGYGFVTFDNETEAQNVRAMVGDFGVFESEKLEFKGRRLNLGPAMRRINYGSRFNDFNVSSPSAAQFYQAPAYQYAIPQYLMDPAATAYAVAAQPAAYPPSPTYLVVPQGQYLHPYTAGIATPATPTHQMNATPAAAALGVAQPAMQPRLLSTVTNKLGSPVKSSSTSGSVPMNANTRQQTGAQGILGGSAITRTPTRSAGAASVTSPRQQQQQQMQHKLQQVQEASGGMMTAPQQQQQFYYPQPHSVPQQQLKQTNSDGALHSQAQQQQHVMQEQQRWNTGYSVATATPASAQLQQQQQQQQGHGLYPTPQTPGQTYQTQQQGYMGGGMYAVGNASAGSALGIRALTQHYNNDIYTNEHAIMQQQHEQQMAAAIDSLKM